MIKEHPYRKIASKISQLPVHQRPRILGLTAHLTYAMKGRCMTRMKGRVLTVFVEGRMARVAEGIIGQLEITKVESADTEEMDNCGYHAHKREAAKVLAPARYVIVFFSSNTKMRIFFFAGEIMPFTFFLISHLFFF
jgi:hypothetical protein